ncbi:PEGA domain-containing protein [Archangium violaceum]|uniref:PEGA domain-containing protein n=1 Tax=Archangium violaceum TaxID=83451 RepID=UPI00194E052D|nr:PEGA domain-containing protein [Archangium violaceum]QRO00478.1 PEGA domain-containing protein [Archangium violaceum]
MHLKTPLALSLALLLGAAPSVSEAAAPGGAAASSRKSKKTPPAEQSTPAPEPTPAPAETPVEAPEQAQAPQNPPAEPSEPAPAPQEQQLPPPAWAGRVAVLAVPADRGTTETASRIETDLRGALGAWPDVQLVDFAPLFPPPPPISLKQGDALFDEGKGLYDNLDTEAAAKKFSEAAAFYRRYAVDTKPERLARVHIFLGASRMLNGDAAGAQESFTQALLASPTVQPETEFFGQDVHEAFNAAKVGLSRQPRGALAIDSLPAGAQVLLHGESVGTTPLKDVELAPGAHQVVLTLPGHLPFGTFQVVESSKRAELRPTLEPTPSLSAVQDLAVNASRSPTLVTDKLPPEVSQLGERLGARYVVLAVVKQEREGLVTALHAWDLQLANRLHGVVLKPGEARGQEAVARVHDFVTGKQVLPSSRLPIAIALPPVVKKPWFWATVGGVAAATTASILLATQPQPKLLGPRLGNPGAGW